MKKSFLRLCLLGISLSSSYAATASVANPGSLRLPPFFGQDTPPQGPPADGQRRPKMGGADQLKDLDLTDKQKSKVEAIMKKQQQQRESLRKQGTDREAMMTEMRRLESETDVELKSVLTAEQYTKYQAKKKDRPQPPKDGQGPPPRRAETE